MDSTKEEPTTHNRVMLKTDGTAEPPHDIRVNEAIDAARAAASLSNHSGPPPATDPPLPHRPGESWPIGYSPARDFSAVNGEICRPGPPVGGVDYKQAKHPYKVFVGGVPLGVKEQDIFDLFEREVGTVAHCQLVLALNTPSVMSPIPRYHRGYAFVTFQSLELRERCLTRNRYILLDKAMEVKSMDSNDSDRGSRGAINPARAKVNGLSNGPGDVAPMCKLFVALKTNGPRMEGQVAPDPDALCEKEMTEHFGHYGSILKVVIVKDKETGVSRGYGFIYYKEPSGPQAALMAGREHVMGNKTRVEVKPFLSGAAGMGLRPVPGMMPISMGAYSQHPAPMPYTLPQGYSVPLYGTHYHHSHQVYAPYTMGSHGPGGPHGHGGNYRQDAGPNGYINPAAAAIYGGPTGDRGQGTPPQGGPAGHPRNNLSYQNGVAAFASPYHHQYSVADPNAGGHGHTPSSYLDNGGRGY